MKPFFFIILFCFTNYCFAQEPAIAEANYHFVHIRDTTQKNKPYYEDYTLLVGNSSSAYRSADNAAIEKKQKEDIQQQVRQAADPNHLNLTITGYRPVSASEYYQFQNTHKLYIKQLLVNSYLIEDELPSIDWKITADTSTIGGYRCQKATTHYKGRDYSVWFCQNLPFHAGPWELNGLPGLILQAEDSRNEVSFTFKGFKDIRAEKRLITVAAEAIKISKKDFTRLQNLEKSDPTAFYSMPANRKSNVNPFEYIDRTKISSINVKKTPDLFNNTINNPIERTEK